MNKIVLSSKNLKAAMATLSQAVNKKGVLPVLSDLCLRANGSQVTLITTDLELTILYTMDAEVSGDPFDALLPFDFLKKVVDLNPNMPLVIEFNKDCDRVSIHGMNDSYDITSLNKYQDYPAIPTIPSKNSIRINGTFISWLNRAMVSVSHDETRPALTKICLDIMSDGLTMTSTDAHIMFTRTFPVESKTEEMLLVSPKIAKALADFSETTITWREKHVAFQCDNVTVISTRPEDKYPDYKMVIPNYEKNLLVDKKELCNALEKCALSSIDTKQTVIYLQSSDATIRLEADDTDKGRKIDVTITGKYEGPVEKIAINADKLLSLLSQVEYDKVQLHIHNPKKAVLLSSQDDPAYTGLLMPLMLEN